MMMKLEGTHKKSIASYQPRHRANETWYVQAVPGDGGKDWGWTTKRAEAAALTPYWQLRFLANARRCRWFAAKVEDIRKGEEINENSETNFEKR